MEFQSLLFPLFFLVLSNKSGHVGCESSSPSVLTIDGDYVLGVVLPVHFSTVAKDNRCGAINARGVQAVNVIIDTLTEINTRGELPFTIGVAIVDDCYYPTRSASIVASHFQHREVKALVDLVECSGESGSTGVGSDLRVLQKVVGVISGVHVREDARLAVVSALFNLPVVSYRSAYKDLRNEELIKTLNGRSALFHTPPKEGLPTAICQLLAQLGWNYVTLVESEGSEEWYLSAELHACFMEKGICLATHLLMKREDDQSFDRIVSRLMTQSLAKAVVVIDPNGRRVRKLFEAAKRANLSGTFRWFDPSGWGRDSFDATGIEDVMSGAITLQHRMIPDHANHFSSLREKSTRLPWFSEYVDANVTDRMDIELVYVREAVYAYKDALSEMHSSNCPSPVSCHYGSTPKRFFYLLTEALKTARFGEGHKPEVDLFMNGFGRTNFTMKEYREDNGSYSWTEIRFPFGSAEFVRSPFYNRLISMAPSVCSHPCRNDQRKATQYHDSCCWVCVDN